MKNKSQTNPDLNHSADSQKNQPETADPMLTGLDALYAAGPAPELTARAMDRLLRSLPAADTVYYQSLRDTPLGDLFVAVGDRGLLAVDFGIPESTFIERITQKTGALPVRSQEETADAALQIQDYLAGGLDHIDLPVDLEALTDFQREVLDTTTRIPRGQVTTYGEIARRIGRPGAARAVGQALGRNPVPIVIPCHRVIAGDGTLGGYSGGGGLQSKTHLLQLEGAQLMI